MRQQHRGMRGARRTIGAWMWGCATITLMAWPAQGQWTQWGGPGQDFKADSTGVGDYVYGSTGMQGPSFFAAINVKTGKVAWRKRGFAKATCVYADGRIIILDEDGQLALVTATPDDLSVHSKVNMLESKSWTVPTVVGKNLYIRDQKSIMALDLAYQAVVKVCGTGLASQPAGPACQPARTGPR